MPSRHRAAVPPPFLLPTAVAAQGIAVRAQGDADIAALRALYGANRARELALTPWPDAAKQRFLDDQFRLQSAHFAARHAGAEFLVLTRMAPSFVDAVIGRLYVDRRAALWELLEIGLARTEQRRGVGTALIEHLKAGATDAAALGIGLHVAIDNVRAAALYRRLGFSERAAPSATHLRMEWRAPR